jgi:hypothetical protein
LWVTRDIHHASGSQGVAHATQYGRVTAFARRVDDDRVGSTFAVLCKALDLPLG